MKISLITPTYNSASTITRTIDSVIAQNYIDLEYIIIDGASSDNTQEIVLSYQDRIKINFVSEPDSGIYDAMNKGVRLASGDVIGILNSDDLFAAENILETVEEAFKDSKIEAVYGDIKYFSSDVNQVNRYWRTGEYRDSKLSNGWIIPHPTLFLKKSVYDKFGLYNTDFKIAGDYEFILRILKSKQVVLKYVPEVFIKMFDGGVSGRNLEQRNKGWQELKQAWLVNNLKVPRFFIVRRVLFKISQLLFK